MTGLFSLEPKAGREQKEDGEKSSKKEKESHSVDNERRGRKSEGGGVDNE